MLANLLIYGLVQGVILILTALGFSLTFGLSKVANFAHGGLYLLAGIVTWLLLRRVGLPYPLAILLALVFNGIIGALIYRLILMRVRGIELSEVISTFAVGVAILELFRWLGFVTYEYNLPAFVSGQVEIAGIFVDYHRLLIVAIALIVAVSLWLFTHRTKTGLALAETAGDAVRVSAERRFPSRDFGSLEEIVTRFLGETGVVCDCAVFAVAGPVHQDRSRITNLPWELDARNLERVPGVGTARLLNDLEAVAWGIPALGADDFAVLNPGEVAAGNACVIAAGTGLGEAGLYWDGKRHCPFATEGGHSDFAPADEREVALFDHLKARYGHVSWERVVSGMGIGDMYEFLAAWRGAGVPERLREALAAGDAGAAVAAGAADGSCPICRETMDLFVTLYGREAGNLALKLMTLGGVYLGGGIAPQNLEWLRQPAFLAAFCAKGRMEPLMRRMPVKVILDQRAPLYGAARFMAEG
jgi:glucokinase